MDILDDLLETGIDGLNPVEKSARMVMEEVFQRYGHRLFIAGGIDAGELLAFGKVEEVKAECLRMIATVESGYFIGSTTELGPAVKLENVLAMIEVEKHYKGKSPGLQGKPLPVP